MNGFPLQGLLEDLVSVLEKRGTGYLIMGGVAVRYWAIPRPTFDLDLTLALDEAGVPALCGALEEAGFSVPEAHAGGFLDELRGMKKFKALHFAEGREVSIDLFLAATAYQKEAFRRRVRVRINGMEAWMISAEDLLLHKLIAGRDRDLGDVTDILWMNPGLDRGYLRQWAGPLQVSDLLEQKLRANLP